MRPRVLGQAVVCGLGLWLCLVLLVQLGARANRADAAVSAIRRDGRQVTVLLDRPAGVGMLSGGWATPVAGQGARTSARTAYLVLPTSTAAGDLDLCFVLAATEPVAPGQAVGLRVADEVIGVWRPRTTGPETACFRAPGRLRARSYEIAVALDLIGGLPGIRIISASDRIRRS